MVSVLSPAVERKLGTALLALEIDVPNRPFDVARRHHNRFVKESLREALDFHHKQIIPRHFQPGARQRYGYAPRTAKYEKYKLRRFGHRKDLVLTGRSERHIRRNRTITIGGAAEGGQKKVEGKLSMRFAFPGGTGRFRRTTANWRRVTIQQMIRELQATTKDERAGFAKNFSEGYWRRYRAFQGGRKRRRLPRR